MVWSSIASGGKPSEIFKDNKVKLKISFDATPTAGHSLIMFTLSVISPGTGGLEVQSVDNHLPMGLMFGAESKDTSTP